MLSGAGQGEGVKGIGEIGATVVEGEVEEESSNEGYEGLRRGGRLGELIISEGEKLEEEEEGSFSLDVPGPT